MKALNLYLFTRVPEPAATAFENTASERLRMTPVRTHEFYTVKVLTELLCDAGASVEDLDGFFFSFCIEQIGKEFDLLKVDDRRAVLNIELKSEAVSEEKMEAQLRRNRYYLKHIAEDLLLFTFAESSRKVYTLEQEVFREASFDELIKAVTTFGTYKKEGIADLFRPENFLISPHSTPRLFLENQYYLTQQQEQIRMYIMKTCTEENDPPFLGISGKAGTGKTLLLYDLAKEFSNTENCLIVICGVLFGGHGYLRQEWKNMEICSVYELFRKDVFDPGFRREGNGRKISCILLDEADRLPKKMQRAIFDTCRRSGIKLIFSYDPSFFSTEQYEWFEGLEEKKELEQYRLSDRIRSGSALISFFRTMMDLSDRSVNPPDYSPVTVLYADTMEEAKTVISFWQSKDPGCLIGEMTMRYRFEYLQSGKTPRFDTEYDSVLLLLDEVLSYNEEGKLTSKADALSRDHIYRSLYQAVSRARERLCILVIGNEDLFEKLIRIKARIQEKTGK